MALDRCDSDGMRQRDDGVVMPTCTEISSWRELARRNGDGLDVALLWNESSRRLKLSVFDSRSEEQLDVDVEGADALTSFHHPFAYAAWQGLAPTPAPSHVITALMDSANATVRSEH
jgi:hypothetical protein